MYLRINIIAVGFFILSFINTSTSSLSEKSTRENEQCNIALNTGEIIDLSPLFSASQPMILSSNTSLYIYHPCTDVPLNAVEKNNSCQNGYGLCYFEPKTITDKPLSFQDVLSNHTFGSFSLLAVNKEGVSRINQMMEPEIVYKHSKGADIITTYVRLECDEKVEDYILTSGKNTPFQHSPLSEFDVLPTHEYHIDTDGGTLVHIDHRIRKAINCVIHLVHPNSKVNSFERMPCVYGVESTRKLQVFVDHHFKILTLSSKHCCLHREHYMSGWAVFFIILLVFMAIYFLGGILVLKFIRGATGLEMIPNHEFWCKLPELARNGVAYMTSCGKNTWDSYEKI